ncbi:MAG TPA: hypothetical protein VIL79_06345, partial [Thermoleophilia bacterium]
MDLERRVVEIARIAALQSRGEGFEDSAVDPDASPSRAERQPVEIDRCVIPVLGDPARIEAGLSGRRRVIARLVAFIGH